MNHTEFKVLLEELDGNSVETLAAKNAKYSSNGDALHNFRSGADIMGGTPAQACWGYLTKHLTALRDMVEKDNFSDRDDFLEKCQDTINYVRFLWCIGNETRTRTRTTMVEPSQTVCDEKIYDNHRTTVEGYINKVQKTYSENK